MRARADELKTAATLLRNGALDAAERACARILAAAPADADALALAGLLALRRGRTAVAVRSLREAAERAPGRAVHHANLGAALRAAGDLDGAIAACERAIALDGRFAGARRNLGAALLQAGRAEAARDALEAALALEPRSVEGLTTLGAALKMLERLEAAEAVLRRAIAIDAGHAKAWSNLGGVLQVAGDLDAAEAALVRALALDDTSAAAHNNLGNVHMVRADTDAARAAFTRALECDPGFEEARYNRALAALLAGDLDAGWADYEARTTARALRDRAGSALTLWRGEDLGDRAITVFGEQGPGDAIMFARCLADLRDRARRVDLVCEPRLAALLARSFPGVSVRAGGLGDLTGLAAAAASPERVVALGSLPGQFLRSESDFARHPARYLVPDGNARARWAARYRALGGALTVGISWRGGLGVEERRLRTQRLDDWLPIFAVPGVRCVSLQYGERTRDLADLVARHGVTVADWPGAVDDLDDFAAQIDALDLVISVVNTTIHFAAALAKPVWGLTPAVPSWRWQLDRRDCLWYPTLTLYRQRHAGDWGDAIAEVARDLARYAARRS